MDLSWLLYESALTASGFQVREAVRVGRVLLAFDWSVAPPDDRSVPAVLFCFILALQLLSKRVAIFSGRILW